MFPFPFFHVVTHALPPARRGCCSRLGCTLHRSASIALTCPQSSSWTVVSSPASLKFTAVESAVPLADIANINALSLGLAVSKVASSMPSISNSPTLPQHTSFNGVSDASIFSRPHALVSVVVDGLDTRELSSPTTMHCLMDPSPAPR